MSPLDIAKIRALDAQAALNFSQSRLVELQTHELKLKLEKEYNVSFVEYKE
jgi:hypothetical protein